MIAFGSFLLVAGRLGDLVGRKRMFLALSLVVLLSMVLAACAPVATPAPAAAGSSGGKTLKVGLVTDTGGVNDKSFNQSQL